MAWRKWVVRGLVFTVAAAIGVGGVAYQHWTDPAEVRRQVLAQFSAKFPGATVTVDSARLRLLGGIAVTELRMTRRDDADRVNFLHIPSAVIYHDKEQLLGGRLSISKMELERPRLRVVRDSDGKWNLDGLLAHPDLRERLPTLIIKQGTIVVEDRCAQGAAPVEITNVCLTVINDPELTVTIEGAGTSRALGPVRLSGTWQRDTGQTSLTCDATAVPVGPALVQRLSGVCADLAEHAHDLSGSGNLHAALDYHPGSARPWGHDVTFTLTDGKFSHKLLPLPLEKITASVRCVNGHIARAEANGQAGAASVRVTLDDVTLPVCGGQDSCWTFESLFKKLDVTVDNLPVTEWLIQNLPERYRVLQKEFAPAGSLNLTDVFWHDDKGLLHRRLTLLPQGMSASFEKFPYRVERITGNIVHSTCRGEPDRLDVDLIGHAGAQPVFIKAAVKGTKPDSTVTVDVWGKNIPLDDKLLRALQTPRNPKLHALAESFHPTGLADFRVHSDWHRDASFPDGGRYDNRYVITFHDAAVLYDKFRYSLDNVSGVLDIRPDHWEFHDFRGSHGDCTLFTSGRSWRDVSGREHVEVALSGEGVRLDDDLKNALVRKEMQRVWATFRPEGRIDFDGTLRIEPGAGEELEPDIALTVWPRGCRVTPQFFAYALDDLRGKVRYERGTVELGNITARHGDTRVTLDRGIVQLKPGGGFLADLLYLHGNPLVTDHDFITALPPALQKGVGALAVSGPLEVHTRLYIDAPPGGEPPHVYWDGSATVRDATVHTGVALEHVTGTVAMRGWHNGHQIDGAAGNLDVRELTLFNQPIRNLRGEILMTEDEPDVVKFPGLLANYFGGQVYGPLRLELGSKLRYRLDLTAAQVKLEEFGRRNFNNSDLNGLAVAQVYLEGEGGELSALRGNGRIDVPSGHMYNLPLLLDLLKFLGLRLPDRTAFEEAHVVFDIEGMRAHVKQLELYGNAVSLRGHGDTNIDGSDMAFVFYLDWARLGQVLPAGVREVPREISNQLFRIDMRGKVGDVHFREVPVPLLLGPLKRVFAGDEEDRWGGGTPKK
jgi:hypothetical protein